MKEARVSLALALVTEHSREGCSDENPTNWHSGYYTDVPAGTLLEARCERCALLKALNEPEFREQIAIFIRVQVNVPYLYEPAPPDA
jgi:hypothetical protein